MSSLVSRWENLRKIHLITLHSFLGKWNVIIVLRPHDYEVYTITKLAITALTVSFGGGGGGGGGAASPSVQF